MIDKIRKLIEKWIEMLDKLLDSGEYQPSHNEPTQYS